jgi:hypothetical protein
MDDKQLGSSNFFHVDGDKDLLYEFLKYDALDNPDRDSINEDPYADNGK